MGLLNALRRRLAKASPNRPVDISETVSDVVGGGLIGLAVGELAEEGVKEIKKARAKPRARKGNRK